MKQVSMQEKINRFTIKLVFLMLCMSSTLLAYAIQEEHIEKIIIRKNVNEFDKNQKILLEINNDGVTINGRPINEFEVKGLHIKINKDLKENSHRPYAACSPGDSKSVKWKKRREKPFLGVISYSNKEGEGVILKKITPNSAAEFAGLKKGDIIIRVDNEKISSQKDLVDVIRSRGIGEEIKIVYLRDEKEYRTQAKLRKWEPKEVDVDIDLDGEEISDLIMHKLRNKFKVYLDKDDDDYRSKRKTVPKLGIEVETLEFGDGLKVLHVEADSYAAKAGIEKNDIIIKAGNRTISQIQDFKRVLMEKAREHDRSLNLEIKRKNLTKKIAFIIPKPKIKATF